MRSLIVTADDFGYSRHVNQAVLRAHRLGILTSASLMVAEEGCDDAVEIARSWPSLAVGLHLCITHDRALLPTHRLPLVTKGSGRFEANQVKAGWLYLLSKQRQAELREEIQAQFNRFRETGIPWSHVDGHQHFHMHPAIFEHVLDLCDTFGVHRVRIPNEPIRHRLNGTTRPLSLRAVVLSALCRRNRRVLRQRQDEGKRPLFYCRRVLSTIGSRPNVGDFCDHLIHNLSATTNELYLHPGANCATPLPSDLASQDVADFDLFLMLHPLFRHRLDQAQVAVGTYAEVEALAQPKQQCTPAVRSGNAGMNSPSG